MKLGGVVQLVVYAVDPSPEGRILCEIPMSRFDENLKKAIADAYRSEFNLRELAQYDMGTPLEQITGLRLPQGEMILGLLNWADSEGRLVELVLKAHRRVPGNPTLKAVVAPLMARLAAANTSWDALSDNPSNLEKIVLPGVPFHDVAPWVEKLTRMFRTVCRVEPQPPGQGLHGFGSGFLVAADVIMTNYHVIESFLHHGAENVRCRFDYAVDTAGNQRTGTLVELLPHAWHILSSPKDALDFALVRLARRVGDDQFGGESRHAVKITEHAFTLAHPLLVLHHPDARPLQLTLGSVVKPVVQISRVGYNANTEPGSSGSPVLTSALDAVALHRAGPGSYNEGVRFDAIRPFLAANRAKLDAVGLGSQLD